MPKLGRKRQEASGRKAERMSKVGREFETEVSALLQKMQDERAIVGFVAHDRHSVEDLDGRDFTVTAMSGGEPVEKSFGVTISLRRWRHSKVLHPETAQFCFPLGTKPETIRKRILELFEA